MRLAGNRNLRKLVFGEIMFCGFLHYMEGRPTLDNNLFLTLCYVAGMSTDSLMTWLPML
jgi:hypothetical protein